MPRLLRKMCEWTYSFTQWKNRVRTMTFGFGFCSVLYGIALGSVLGKTRVLVRFLPADFGFFPKSSSKLWCSQRSAKKLTMSISLSSISRTCRLTCTTTGPPVQQRTHTRTHTHSVLTAIFPGEPGLPGCPLILLLHLFLICASFWDSLFGSLIA